MPGQDVRQLLLQVDASVAVAQRNLSALRTQVERDTSAMETSLAKPGAASEAAGERIAHSSGNARAAQMELMHVVRASSDSFAAGQHVATIFAMEIGKVAQAASMAGEGMGRFGAIMGGPWGLAITAGISVLATFLPRLFETRTELQKATDGLAENARKAETNRQAQEAYGHTLPAITAAIREQTAALDSQNRSMALNAQLALIQARQQRATLEISQSGIGAQLQTARQQRDRLRRDFTLQNTEGMSPADAASAQTSNVQALAAAEGAVRELERQLASTTAGIAASDRLISGHGFALAEALRTAEGRINATFEARRGQMTERAAREHWSQRQIFDADAVLDVQRQRTLRVASEAEAAERRLNDTRETGRRVTAAQAAAIARGIGGTVTSSTRSYTEQAHLYAEYRAGRGPLAAPPGSSAHERGTAIDITGVSIGAVREAFRAAGVHLRQLLLETNPRTGSQHVHADFGAGSRAGPSADTLARRQAAAQMRQVHQEDQFETEFSQANERLIQAKRELATSTESQVAFAIEQARIDGQQRDEAYQHQVNEHRLTAAEAKRLTALNDAATEARVAAIQQREDRRLAEEASRMQAALLDTEREMLDGKMALAGTEHERLSIARRMLAIEEQQERNAIANTLRPGSGASSDQIGRALAQYQNIDQRYANRGAVLDQQYEGPAARRLRELRGEVGDLNVAFENLGVHAMDRLADATTDEIKNLLHLHGVLGDIIGDFLQLAIHRGELALFDSIQGGGGKSGGGGGFGGFLRSLGSIFGGSGPKGAGSADPFGGALKNLNLGFGGAREGGGDVYPGMAYLVGEKRPEMFVPKVAGTIMPRVPQVRVPQAANNNARVHVEVSLDSGMLQAKIVRTSAGVTASMAPAISAEGSSGALKTAARRAGRRIPTGF